MATATLAYGDVAKDATLTATNAQTSLPASNMQHPHLTKYCQISGLTTQIDIDAGANVTARQLVLGGLGDTAITGFSTVTIKASTSAIGSTDQLDYDGNSLSGSERYGFSTTHKQALCDFASDVTARYWRVNLTATGATNLRIGSLLLLKVASVSINIGYPFSIQTRPRSLVREMAGGQRNIYQRDDVRVANFIYGIGITAADAWDTLVNIVDRTASTHSLVAFTPDPADTTLGVDQMIIGYFEDLGAANFAGFNQVSKSFALVEAR